MKTMKMRFAERMPKGEVARPAELWQFYIDTCEDYTARGLTYASDTLPAVSSIMSTMSLGLGEYYAGTWEYGLLISLQWEAMNTKDCVRHENYVAPSWSWASRSGAVMWYMQEIKPSIAGEAHDFATIVDVSCTLATADPYGKISASHLTLEGFTTTMSIESMEMLEPDG